MKVNEIKDAWLAYWVGRIYMTPKNFFDESRVDYTISASPETT